MPRVIDSASTRPRYELRKLAGVPDWSELIQLAATLAPKVIALVHELCGSTRSHTEHAADGTVVHTCLDCALSQARAAKEK